MNYSFLASDPVIIVGFSFLLFNIIFSIIKVVSNYIWRGRIIFDHYSDRIDKYSSYSKYISGSNWFSIDLEIAHSILSPIVHKETVNLIKSDVQKEALKKHNSLFIAYFIILVCSILNLSLLFLIDQDVFYLVGGQ